MARNADIEEEYGLGGAGGGTTITPAARTTWAPGILIQPGQILEPRRENGFQYKAVQTSPAYTGASEPDWPETPGGTVVDGGVTWEAIAKTSVTWTAIPLYKTGGIEPTWPTVLGGTVVENGITWTAKAQNITDPYCPHSRIAHLIASKVYSPYRGVTRFCATDDPTDWSAEADAGFLSTETHSPVSPMVTGLGEYRGRLVVATADSLQLWTVDPDPAESAIYDTIRAIGTNYDKVMTTVAGDLYLLTKQGVRSLSIAASNATIAAGDIGSGIDALVIAKLAGPDEPVGTYYPGNGQFWLIFAEEAFVYTRSAANKVGAWSRYVFPWPIESTFHLNGELYVRANGNFYRFDENVTHDDGVAFEGVVHTPYLDLGAPGGLKEIVGIDMVGYGTCELAVGYDQRDTALYTEAVELGPDNLPEGPMVIPVCAPSMAFKLTFPAGQSWQLNALTVYLEDMGVL